MRALLDTQTFVQAYSGDLKGVPLKVRELLVDPESERLLSSISIVEIAVKNAIGKLDMSAAETNRAIRDLRLTTMTFGPRHALRLFSLPLTDHHDPFDRMLICTALTEKVPVVGGDRKFKKYPGLEVFW